MPLRDLYNFFASRCDSRMKTKFCNIPVRVQKVDKDYGLVFGIACVCTEDGEPYVDLQHQHVTEEAMLGAAIDFAKSERPILEMHEGEPRGEAIFSFPVTQDVADAFGISPRQTGLWIGAQVDEEMAKKFDSGELTSFSIAGRMKKYERVTIE